MSLSQSIDSKSNNNFDLCSSVVTKNDWSYHW